jgi:UDP-3-O-[3-hydroxymyristoyl] glucosamine N-acyltransferase
MTAHLSLENLIQQYAHDIIRTDFSENKKTTPEFSALIMGLAPLSHATENHCSFFANQKYLEDAKKTLAGYVLCQENDFQALRSKNKHSTLVICKNPYVLFARLGQFFFKPKFEITGIHAQSHIDSSAEVHPSATIYPFAFVGPGAHIGARSVVYSGCFIGAASTVGEDCILYANSVLREGCKLGDRCILNPGAVVGGDGFGFAPFEMENVKIPQIGGVRIENDVEVGANSAIDRGALNDTVVCEQTKIDSLVMIAHNVEIGKACFIAAQSGIAGSSKLGNRVVLAGQVGVSGHVTIGDNVTMLAQSGASKNVAPNQIMNGSPAKTNREHLLQMAIVNKIVKEKLSEKNTSEKS